MAHYYTPDGVLISHVPMKTREGTRETTIADARKLGLLPSVTTILSCLNKPLLNNWRVEQGVKAALNCAQNPLTYLDPEGAVKDIVRQSEEYTNWAADWGTEFHAGVSAHLKDQLWLGRLEIMDKVVAFIHWLDVVGFEVTDSERTFVSLEYGYASTLDLLGTMHGKRILADLKTQDFEEPAKAQFHEEYKWQLAGYALGIGEPDITRMSFVVSRTVPGVVAVKNWSEKEGANERDVEAWVHLLNFWKVSKEWGK